MKETKILSLLGFNEFAIAYRPENLDPQDLLDAEIGILTDYMRAATSIALEADGEKKEDAQELLQVLATTVAALSDQKTRIKEHGTLMDEEGEDDE
jgi:hypothetical protein